MLREILNDGCHNWALSSRKAKGLKTKLVFRALLTNLKTYVTSLSHVLTGIPTSPTRQNQHSCALATLQRKILPPPPSKFLTFSHHPGLKPVASGTRRV